MRADTLTDMVAHMSARVGLVHQMPFACDRPGLPCTLEKVYFGTSHARLYLSANLVGINCATGMSSLMRKDVLDEAGGLKAYGCYLAEDFFMAETMLKKVGKHIKRSQNFFLHYCYRTKAVRTYCNSCRRVQMHCSSSCCNFR